MVLMLVARGPALRRARAQVMCGGVKSNGEKNVGLSRSKHSSIKGIAEEFASGRLSLAALEALSDLACCQRLCALKGIGEWTAGVFMLHFLNRPDILLYGDLTVRTGLRDLYNLGAQCSPLLRSRAAASLCECGLSRVCCASLLCSPPSLPPTLPPHTDGGR
jgi:3-methyladenine DNA glycosylase/8-oxoguanine DNA glycosylase